MIALARRRLSRVPGMPASTLRLTWSVGGFLLLCLALAWFAPPVFWVLLVVVALAGAAGLALWFPVAATVIWLLFLASTPEMWLGDLIGHMETIIALDKLAGLGLAGLCILRYGARFDAFNPGLAFPALFIAGAAHGLYPGLTLAASLRSLVGSAAPFAFSFSRLSRRWAAAVIRVACWAPLVVVLFGAGLTMLGLRPLFVVQEGAVRLFASSLPAFLGGFALIGIYAGTVELFRGGRVADMALLIVNAAILLLTGARAPLLAAALLTGAALLAVPSARFGLRRRLPLILAGGLVLPLALAAARALSFLRVIDLAELGQGASLSNRALIWPVFQAAANRSPWLGWGVGAGKVVVRLDSPLARLLGTNAAHNEYLRLAVEGGYPGLILVILLMGLWAWHHTKAMAMPDRALMRLVFLAFAAHSFTDNTMIATTGSLMFAWVSAVFARAAAERQAAGHQAADPIITAALSAQDCP